MTEPTTDDDSVARALRGMPLPAAPSATREAHLAAAMAEFDALQGSRSHDAEPVGTNVISLASRRRPRLMALTAVAAAALFAVGLGVGRSSAPGAPDTGLVKNAALPTTTCADLGIASNAVPVARFGTYAVHRTVVKGRKVLAIVDATCGVVAQFDLGG
ncbi:MAG: hypothetical protein RJB08_1577 [Actinomycetota bacterium]|jgi:hypothetical protein